MELSHISHAAFDRNYRHLTKYFCWPGMVNDIKIHTKTCPQCREYSASQPHNIWTPDSAKDDIYFAPFSHIGIDVFTYDNKNYLIIVCRFSGYPIVEKLPSMTTATIIEKIWQNIIRYGIPLAIRSDGARYFISEEMKEFCKKYHIKLEQSSSYYAPSNGLAEAGVKNMKNLLKKTTNWENFQLGYLAYITTTRKDGTIPCQLFLGRLLRTLLPVLPDHYRLMKPAEVRQMERQKEEALDKQRIAHNKGKRSLPPLLVGQQVYIQGQDGKWTNTGIITHVRSSGSYIIESNGKTYIRARHFLKEVLDKQSNTPLTPSITHLRRSPRLAKKVKIDESNNRIEIFEPCDESYDSDESEYDYKRGKRGRKSYHCYVVSLLENTSEIAMDRNIGNPFSTKVKLGIDYNPLVTIGDFNMQEVAPSCIPRPPFRPQRVMLTVDLRDLRFCQFSAEAHSLVDSILLYIDRVAREQPHCIAQFEVDRTHSDNNGVFRQIYSQTLKSEMASIALSVASLNPEYDVVSICLYVRPINCMTRRVTNLYGQSTKTSICRRYDWIATGQGQGNTASHILVPRDGTGPPAVGQRHPVLASTYLSRAQPPIGCGVPLPEPVPAGEQPTLVPQITLPCGTVIRPGEVRPARRARGRIARVAPMDDRPTTPIPAVTVEVVEAVLHGENEAREDGNLTS